MSVKVRLRRWKPGFLSILICVLALASCTAALYPSAASWLSSYQQSLIIEGSIKQLAEVHPDAAEQLRMANAYNDALIAGVQLESGATVPTANAGGVGGFSYGDVLNANDDGLMGRIKIDAINVDIPIYHGTDEQTLLKGAGHLEGSHLPVGGDGTRSVITAHRGLASATLFSNLDRVKIGDRFQLMVMGEVLSYEVRTVDVIQPEETDTLLPVAGKDLATLITCTPLGINSHRIVVTGERVTPTPIRDLDLATTDPTVPGFPWWALASLVLLVAIGGYLVRSGFVDGQQTAMKSQPPILRLRERESRQLEQKELRSQP